MPINPMFTQKLPRGLEAIHRKPDQHLIECHEEH